VQHLLQDDGDQAEIKTGLEFWFRPPGSDQKRAKPYKQFLITLSVIFPLTMLIPWLLTPLFHAAPILGVSGEWGCGVLLQAGSVRGHDMDIREVAVVKDASLGSRHQVWSDGDQAAMINRQLLAHAVLSTYETIESTRSRVA
jgi:hypothetical protein